MDLLKLAEDLIPVVRDAGAIELKYYHEGAEVIDKADGSPVTLADQEAEKLIFAALKKIAPDIPVVGEEAVAEVRRVLEWGEWLDRDWFCDLNSIHIADILGCTKESHDHPVSHS